MWEVLNLNLLVIFIGSLLGALKANLNDIGKKSKWTRIVNVILGVFCGISIGLHYEEDLTIWLVGLSSLTVSMLSVSMLDTVYDLTPTITKYLIELKIGKSNE